MRPGIRSRVTIPQTIVPGFRSSQDPRRAPHLNHERKKRCEDLSVEAAMEGFILLTRNYPVAIVRMVSVCRSVVNGLNKVAYCWISPGVYPNHELSTGFSAAYKAGAYILTLELDWVHIQPFLFLPSRPPQWCRYPNPFPEPTKIG
jgi:hypothetical protein